MTRFRTGDRVTLIQHGKVEYERSGFARVKWDSGSTTLVWTAGLKLANPMRWVTRPSDKPRQG